MPAQHGQTYDPNEEPTPRGGWFGFVERPYPERLDRAFRVLAAVVGVVVAAALAVAIVAYAGAPASAIDFAWTLAIPLIAAAMAYGFTRALGMILSRVVWASQRMADVIRSA